MKYSSLLFLLFSLILLHCPATSYGEKGLNALFEKANSAYSKGDFASSADLYEQLIATNGYSSGALYNLANSYARLGRTGEAVLNYERALRLSPGDSDITGNLKLVKTHNGLFEEEKNYAETITHLLTMNQWILLATTLLGAYSLLLLFSCRFVQLRRNILPLGLCASFLIAVAFSASLKLYREWNGSIVVKPEVRLMISPFEGAAGIGDIQEGRTVFPKGKKHGEYSYVEDTTGREGWIINNAIQPVIPE